MSENRNQPVFKPKLSPSGLFQAKNSFLSDANYSSQKDVKEFSTLVKEQEKLLKNIQELKAKPLD